MDKGEQPAQEAGVPEHIALVDKGCHHICNPDWERRFSSLDDAVDRLLPYHVSAQAARIGGSAPAVVQNPPLLPVAGI